jgi:hypothetical protein
MTGSAKLADGGGDDLAQHRLTGSGPDVPPVGQHRHAEQHHAEDAAEQQLGMLGPDLTGLLEQRHPVGDRLHAGQRAAPGRERLSTSSTLTACRVRASRSDRPGPGVCRASGCSSRNDSFDEELADFLTAPAGSDDNQFRLPVRPGSNTPVGRTTEPASSATRDAIRSGVAR